MVKRATIHVSSRTKKRIIRKHGGIRGIKRKQQIQPIQDFTTKLPLQEKQAAILSWRSVPFYGTLSRHGIDVYKRQRRRCRRPRRYPARHWPSGPSACASSASWCRRGWRGFQGLSLIHIWVNELMRATYEQISTGQYANYRATPVSYTHLCHRA